MTAPKNTAIRAAIYVRISMDRGGEGLGVARQEKACRALLGKLGWALVDVYTDNDVGAYSGKPRPQWNRLMADVESGAVNAIIAFDIFRITRSTVELEGLIEMADRLGLQLATVQGEVDLSTPIGRLIARILGAVARMESEYKGLRHRAQIQQKMEAGKPHSGARGFGYEVDRVTIREDEAEVIRDIARRVLAGETMSSVVKYLNANGIATANGNRWELSSLKNVLTSARISGRREHAGTFRKGEKRPMLGEIVAVDCWPAVISPEDNDRLRSLLSDPARKRVGPATGRTYLLSGILRCHKCTGRLSGQARSSEKGGKKYQTYKCAVIPGRGGCGGSSVAAGPTDERVRDLVLVAFAEGDIVKKLMAQSSIDPALPAAVRADEARLSDLAEMFAAGDITRGEWKVARDAIDARLEFNRAMLDRASSAAPVSDMVGTYDDLLPKWEAKTIGERRALVSVAVEYITVLPSAPGKFDPNRFDPKWRL